MTTNALSSIRTETEAGVRTIVLSRPDEYNTITEQMARELGAAIDEADGDPAVHVILLRSEGPAFCAGYGLDWATKLQAEGAGHEREWDSPGDLQLLSKLVDVYAKLWYASKPTIAAVQGWCICGGTDIVLWADIVIAADNAVFGYPTSRVWGVPTTPMWIYRMGFERAKRYLLTGDELPAPEAARLGLILETVPEEQLADHAFGLATRMARLPVNQLQMVKLYCNQAADNMGLESTRRIGSIFDGVARHTQEGRDWVARAMEVGFRRAVYERDAPFADYGSRAPRDGR